MLHIAVGTEGEPFLMAPFGIEFYEVAGNVLDAFLGFLLHPVPGTAAQDRQLRGLTGTATAVFAYLVERVDAHVDDIAVLIDDTYHLLIALTAVAGLWLRYADESCKLADAVVDVYEVVAGLELLELASS